MNHWSVKVILFFVLVAFLLTVISNDLPLVRVHDGAWSFPFLNQDQEYNFSKETKDGVFEIHAPFGYSSGKSDPMNMSFRGPFEQQFSHNNNGEQVDISWLKRHWLGTNLAVIC
ncbi:MAG: hypothetical protein IPJ26_09750 [Bacteroidetes bacterium]|nr:hypothetical protein [Bacteroidota bacterium]